MGLRNVLQRWLLVLGSLVTCALLLEAVLYLRYERRVRTALAGRTPDELVTEAATGELLYRLRPGVAGTTNAHGFRDLERSRRRPPGRHRIAVVGDSVSMQMTIPLEELYWRRLQRSLDRTLGEGRVEVLNFGVTGYGAAQQVALLKNEIVRFEPQLILWQFHANDAADPVIDGGNGGLGWYYGRPSSYFARFARRRWIHLRQRARVRAEGLREVPRELWLQVFYWQQMTRRFETVQSLAETHGFQVFVFMLPAWPENDDWSRYPPRALEIHDRLSNRFRELGFPTLDLLPLLQERSPARLRYAPDDPWHPSSEGHQWIAQQLARWLTPQLPRALPGLGS